MALSNFSLAVAIIALVLLTNSSVAYPISPQQQPLLQSESGGTQVLCDPVDIYTTEWFLLNTRARYRREIHDKALFYTKGMTRQARQLACSTREFVTLWDIWPKWLYDTQDVPTNKLRCIHNNPPVAQTFFENMSQAYARMARGHATIMHSFSDYADPPLTGIWGRIELPALQNWTDIHELVKINEDQSLYTVFRLTHKATQAIVERAIQEVQALFRQARANYRGTAESETFGSCSVWDADSEDFLDELF